MGVGVGDGLGAGGESSVVGGQAAVDRGGLGGVALDPTDGIAVGIALDGVAHPVAEEADPAVQTVDLRVVLSAAVGDGRVAAGPWLAVHQKLPALAVVQAVQLGADQVHGVHVVAAHEVEAEAVDVVFLRPVADGLDHVLPEHQLVGGRHVAAAGAVVKGIGAGHAEVVTGDRLVEGVVVEEPVAVLVGVNVEGVVVDHVHDHADPGLVEGLNHFLELGDAGVAIVGIRGIGALGDVVVDGIVAPVPVGRIVGDGLIHGAEVVDGQQMDGVDAHLLQVADTGGDLVGRAVQGGPVLGEGQVLAAVVRGDAGGSGDGEVADVDLPNHRVGALVEENVVVVLPAVGVGVVQIDNHGAVAVDAGSLGADVAGLVRDAAGRYEIGIVEVFVIAFQGDGPDAGGVVFRQGVGAQNGGAGLLIGAGSIETKLDTLRGGRPDLPGRGLWGIDCAEPLLLVCCRSVIFQIVNVVIVVDAGRGGYGNNADQKQRAEQDRGTFFQPGSHLLTVSFLFFVFPRHRILMLLI